MTISSQQELRQVHVPEKGNVGKATTEVRAVSSYIMLYHICQPKEETHTAKSKRVPNEKLPSFSHISYPSAIDG